MYTRMLTIESAESFFLFGPRGVGKTTWLKAHYPQATYLDLLEFELYRELLANPGRLERYLPETPDALVIIDEVQRIPALLHEVHRLIESKHIQFILTGSNARSLKRNNADLLAGRALTYHMYPLTTLELGEEFVVSRSLDTGHLPQAQQHTDVSSYLSSYVVTYLKEEIQQEGLTRNLGAFSRFLETISFSQSQVLSITDVARECAVSRKTVEGYVHILEDLLLAYRIPPFTKKAKRRTLIMHPKFFFFDVGVYRSIRPKGPLDILEEIDGAALETLVFQEILAVNDYLHFGYQLHYWRTVQQTEVDLVLYGERGIVALEIKRTKSIQPKHLRGLKLFLKDYPIARVYLIYGGDRVLHEDNITILPIKDFLMGIQKYI